MEDSVWFYEAQYEKNLQKQFAIWKIQRQYKHGIQSTIQCKINKSLTQSGNDETKNVQKHTCKEN